MTQQETITLNSKFGLTEIAESYVPALIAGDGDRLAQLIGPRGRIEEYKFGRCGVPTYIL